ncbi:hypothetical protein KQI63_09695 [bacterium]|nr:hypothetical protein [bacterium]
MTTAERLAEAKLMRATWKAALISIAQTGQSYQVGERRMTRADLPEVERQFNKWDKLVSRLDGTAPRAKRVIPRD